MSQSQDRNNDDQYIKAVALHGRYSNNFNPQFEMPGASKFVQWKCTKDETNLPNATDLNKILPVNHPKKEEVFTEPNGLRFLWIGHASCLVQMDDFIFVTDPIFSEACGPVKKLAPKRYRPPALTADQLPDKLQAVLISHNHYDHLDYESVRDLNALYGAKLTWYCGEGGTQWFRDCGIENVVELNWWMTHKHANTEIEVSFCPAQHWSTRNILDRNKSLWGGFVVNNNKYKFYFAGDTGYTHDINIFKQIGTRYGPFDLSAIPIGAYHPRFMMEAQHVSPKEAVQIHCDVKSKKSIGIHWGTWALASEYYLEPKEMLEKIVKDRNLDENEFVTVQHGEIINLP